MMSLELSEIEIGGSCKFRDNRLDQNVLGAWIIIIECSKQVTMSNT